MPCRDVTEIIHLVLDDSDRLKTYTFSKKTCGQGVGVESLLLDYIYGYSTDELIQYDPESLLSRSVVTDDVDAFLILKHLFAIQAAVEVLVGNTSGSKNDPCKAAEICYDGEETIIEAQISVDILTEKIKACGACKGCGTKRMM